MWLPVVVLAGLSVFGGLWLHSDLFAFMNDVLRTPVFVGQTQSILSVIIGSLPGVIGIAMAAVLLLKVPLFTEKLQSMGWMFQKLWERKYYLDEIYEAVVIGPLRSIGRFIAEGISQGCVERVGGGMAIVVQATGELARRGTTGLVGSYALYMLLAVAVLVGILV
jgi:NADH-quinone oxidoreductase subunit L